MVQDMDTAAGASRMRDVSVVTDLPALVLSIRCTVPAAWRRVGCANRSRSSGLHADSLPGAGRLITAHKIQDAYMHDEVTLTLGIERLGLDRHSNQPWH